MSIHDCVKADVVQQLIDFVNRYYERTQCICTNSSMGKIQQMMGTHVPCTHCEAKELLQKASGL